MVPLNNARQGCFFDNCAKKMQNEIDICRNYDDENSHFFPYSSWLMHSPCKRNRHLTLSQQMSLYQPAEIGGLKNERDCPLIPILTTLSPQRRI